MKRNTEELIRRKKIAENATSGKWVYPDFSTDANDSTTIFSEDGMRAICYSQCCNDAEFIANNNPETVIRDIDEILEQRTAIEQFVQFIAQLMHDKDNICKKTAEIATLPNGMYDYDKESVYRMFNKDIDRFDVIYARVSTQKQRNDLENQVKTIENFALNNGIKISDVYKDIGSGMNFERKEFQRLLNNVIEHKINRIFITYKDRLSRIGFDMFKSIFEKFNCEIVVLNEIDDEKQVENEIFNEIISLIHCFSMKVYSSRRKEKLKLIEKELEHEENFG